MRGFAAAYGLLASILVGSALGYGLDRWTHLGPLGLLAGTFVGFAAGLYQMYQAMMADAASPPDAPKDGPPDPP